jgi:proteasome lid subunit RPN8/RPN11
MIVLNKEQVQHITEHALGAQPIEACGLLAGVRAEACKTVQKVYFLKNSDNSAEHFSMDPKEQFAAVKDMRCHGWELLGNFHSHLASPARPSAEDKRLAFDSKASYLIISLQDQEQPIIKSFHIENGQAMEEEIIMIGGRKNGRG